MLNKLHKINLKISLIQTIIVGLFALTILPFVVQDAKAEDGSVQQCRHSFRIWVENATTPSRPTGLGEPSVNIGSEPITTRRDCKTGGNVFYLRDYGEPRHLTAIIYPGDNYNIKTKSDLFGGLTGESVYARAIIDDGYNTGQALGNSDIRNIFDFNQPTSAGSKISMRQWLWTSNSTYLSYWMEMESNFDYLDSASRFVNDQSNNTWFVWTAKHLISEPTLTASPSPVLVDQDTVYTLQYTNNSRWTLYNTTVSVNIPAGANVVNAGGGSVIGNTINYTGINVNSGETKTINFTLKYNSSFAGTTQNVTANVTVQDDNNRYEIWGNDHYIHGGGGAYYDGIWRPEGPCINSTLYAYSGSTRYYGVFSTSPIFIRRNWGGGGLWQPAITHGIKFIVKGETRTTSNSIDIYGQPDLNITKSSSTVSPINVDDEITYTLSYNNSGNIPAQNVVITDVLDNGYDFVSCTGGCARSGQTLTWNIGTLNVNETGSVSVTVRTRLEINDGTEVCNMANINADNDGIDAGKDSNRICYEVRAPEITIEKSANEEFVGQNDEVLWTLTVRNTGSISANNVTFRDTVPQNMSAVETGSVTCETRLIGSGDDWTPNTCGVITSNWEDTDGNSVLGNFGDVIVYTVPEIEPNQEMRIIQSMTVDSETENETQICNNFSVIGDNIINIPTSNDSCVTVLAPVLDVEKSVNREKLCVGENLYYTISITNNGRMDSPAGRYQFRDIISADLNYVSLTPNTLEINAVPQEDGTTMLLASTPEIAIGETFQIQIAVSPKYPVVNGTIVSNNAEILSQDEVIWQSNTVETELEGATVTGTVFHDENNNGIRDGAEVCYANTTVRLIIDDENRTTITTTTDEDCQFRVEGLPTDRGIEVQSSVPANMVPTTQGNIVEGRLTCDSVEVLSEGVIEGGCVAGRVYNDVNENGLYDSGIDKPLSGVEIALLDLGENVLKNTTSAENGYYEFLSIRPNGYIIQQINLPGYISTSPDTKNVIVTSGTVCAIADFTDKTVEVLPNTGEVVFLASSAIAALTLFMFTYVNKNKVVSILKRK